MTSARSLYKRDQAVRRMHWRYSLSCTDALCGFVARLFDSLAVSLFEIRLEKDV